MAPTRTAFAALTGRSRLAFTGLVLACLLTVPAAAATPEQKQEAARERIERTTAAIAADRAELDSARERAAAAATRAAGLSALIANGEERSLALADRLEKTESSLAASRKRLARAREYLARHLVAVYVNGGEPSALDLALGAGSFQELTTGSEYLSAIEDTNDRLMERAIELRRELADKAVQLGKAKLAVERHNAALATAEARIAAVQAQAESSAATLASANAARESRISTLKGEISDWQRQIEREQRVSAQEAEQEVEQNLGGPYSIPTYIVMCESGGDYSALNPSSGAGGAYQIIPSTWEAYGGEGLPHEASKAEQDRIAALIWADVGSSAWTCA